MKFFNFGMMLGSMLFLFSCATQQTQPPPQPGQKPIVQNQTPVMTYPAYQGYPQRVMVFPWNISKVDLEKYPHFRNLQIGFGISNRLLDELYASGRFELIEEKQAVLARMLQQMQKCTNGLCDGNYAPLSKLSQPQYIVYPEVYHLGVEKNVSVSGLNARAKLRTEIGVQINFVDTRNGVTRALGSYIGAFPTTQSGSVLSNPKIDFSQSALGKAAQLAIRGALIKAIQYLPVNQNPPPPPVYQVSEPISPPLVAASVTPAKPSATTIRPQIAMQISHQQYVTVTEQKVSRQSSEGVHKPAITTTVRKGEITLAGKFYALIIGNNDYRYVNKLVTAVNDAKVVAQVLHDNYGYETIVLYNATRQDIIGKLDDLRRNLDQKDNLLIYYAGHGYLDEEADRGYWLPVNASTENTAEWISNTDITDKIKTIKAKHILLVADSCYSGTLTRGLVIPLRSKETLSEYHQRMLKKRSRTVLSSGGLEPVADGGRNNHSVFANAFLDTLNENKGVIDGTEFFNQVRRKVILQTTQTPEYADIRFAGHDGGDYLFIHQ